MGWSTELLDVQGTIFNAASLDWSAGASGIAAEGLGWRFRLPALDVRIFENGAANAIPGIVEIPRLPKHKPFYLACQSRAVETIERWGRLQCQDFVDLGIESGLPAGWKLFHAAAATSDELIRERFPALAFNSTVRIYFEGGVRSSRNQYFSFGLPQLVVDGGDESTFVYCGEARLEAGEEGKFSIPESVVHSGRLSIEVKRDEAIITKRSLFISDEISAAGNSSLKVDRFGRVFQPTADESFVSGPFVSSEPPPYNVVFLPDASKDSKLIFIGRVPGQIASLGTGDRPKDWNPVWAIQMHRNGTAMFCGSGLRDSEPMPERVNDKKQLKEWKRILWHRRKRITPPAHDGLKRLWLSYQEEAAKL